MNPDASDLIGNASALGFVRQHEQDDPYKIALSGRKAGGLPASLLARQIESRQKAASKLPEWHATSGIVFPDPENLRQSSSEATARYKRSLSGHGPLTDLTGGTGVDAFYLSDGNPIRFVDPDPVLCRLAGHNISLLGGTIETHETTAEEFIRNLPAGDRIFIDPSRRDDTRRQLVSLRDCIPDITALLPLLLQKSEDILLKASPMIDIQAALDELEHHASEVHVVEWEGECREILFRLTRETHEDPPVSAVRLEKQQHFTFSFSEERAAEASYGHVDAWLYEPSAAFMKAGPFKSICRAFNVQKLNVSTHLYTSDKQISGFPGRIFRVIDVQPFSVKTLKSLTTSGKANITTRNFPHSVAEVRKKSGIREGGKDYLFLFRGPDNELLVCRCRRPEKSDQEINKG